MIELLYHNLNTIRVPALRAIGNMTLGDDDDVEVLLNCRFLSAAVTLLSENTSMELKKDVCWALSNITAGADHHIQKVMDAKLFPFLVKLLESEDYEIRYDVGWTFCCGRNCRSDVLSFGNWSYFCFV